MRLAYSMTNNKIQGQTFQNIGLELPTPVFAHGQLYAATSEEDVRVKLQETEDQSFQNGMVFTRNILILRLLHNPNSPFSYTRQT